MLICFADRIPDGDFAVKDCETRQRAHVCSHAMPSPLPPRSLRGALTASVPSKSAVLADSTFTSVPHSSIRRSSLRCHCFFLIV